MTLYCATGNPGKLREFQLAAGGVEIAILPGLRDLPAFLETGDTFEENAVAKALYYAPHAPGRLFADDSGLEVEALGGAPGVRSARFAGGDEANRRALLASLRGVDDRHARFVCAIALAERDHLIARFHGAVEGLIAAEPRGTQGFGYDPLFYYPPFGCTFAEVSASRKFAVSHRGQALRAMLAFLREGCHGEVAPTRP